MMARNHAEVRTWRAPPFATGATELAFVGDLDLATTGAAVAANLGHLPARKTKPALAELNQRALPASPFTKTCSVRTEIPQGNVHLCWPTTDRMDSKRDRRLCLLTAILGDRLRVKSRGAIGGTSSPGPSSTTSDTFPGYGYIHAACIVDPAMAAKLSEGIVAIGEDLATNGATENALTRARQPARPPCAKPSAPIPPRSAAASAARRKNPPCSTTPRDRIADTEAITTAQLAALAKQYPAARGSRVTLLPAVPP
jgi:zinc protease